MYRNLCMVLVLFVVSGSTGAWGPHAKKLQLLKECKKSSGVSEELYLDMIVSGVDANMIDPNGQCFVGCYLDRRQIFDTNGTLTEAAKTKVFDLFINGDEVVEGFQACAFLPSDNCERKFKSYLCVRDGLVNVAKKRE